MEEKEKGKNLQTKKNEKKTAKEKEKKDFISFLGRFFFLEEKWCKKSPWDFEGKKKYIRKLEMLKEKWIYARKLGENSIRSLIFWYEFILFTFSVHGNFQLTPFFSFSFL